MSLFTMTKLSDLEAYDRLKESTKEIFRENNLDYAPGLWFQCTMVTDSEEAAAKVYKDNYWRYCNEMDERYGTN